MVPQSQHFDHSWVSTLCCLLQREASLAQMESGPDLQSDILAWLRLLKDGVLRSRWLQKAPCAAMWETWVGALSLSPQGSWGLECGEGRLWVLSWQFSGLPCGLLCLGVWHSDWRSSSVKKRPVLWFLKSMSVWWLSETLKHPCHHPSRLFGLRNKNLPHA